MKVGILKPISRSYNSMIQVYKKILEYNGIPYIDLDVNDPDFWDELKTCDLFLAKFTQNEHDVAVLSQILPVIDQYLKIPCFPNYNTAWHYEDKIKQYYLLKQFGFPVAESYIFWDQKRALNWIEKAKYPVVFKLKTGSASANVKLIHKKHQAKKLVKKSFKRGIHPYWFYKSGKLKSYNWDIHKISKYFLKPYIQKILKGTDGLSNYSRQKNYILFQKFMPHNEYDTRVAVLGGRAWAFKRFNRKNDFRASGSNMYDTRRDQLDKGMIRIAFDISEKLGFQSMAYDFVYDENKNPVILEISYTYGDYPEFSNGYYDKDLQWHEGSFVPEYLEIVDALNMPELRQPDIELQSPYKKASMLV